MTHIWALMLLIIASTQAKYHRTHHRDRFGHEDYHFRDNGGWQDYNSFDYGQQDDIPFGSQSGDSFGAHFGHGLLAKEPFRRENVNGRDVIIIGSGPFDSPAGSGLVNGLQQHMTYDNMAGGGPRGGPFSGIYDNSGSFGHAAGSHFANEWGPNGLHRNHFGRFGPIPFVPKYDQNSFITGSDRVGTVGKSAGGLVTGGHNGGPFRWQQNNAAGGGPRRGPFATIHNYDDYSGPFGKHAGIGLATGKLLAGIGTEAPFVTKTDQEQSSGPTENTAGNGVAEEPVEDPLAGKHAGIGLETGELLGGKGTEAHFEPKTDQEGGQQSSGPLENPAGNGVAEEPVEDPLAGEKIEIPEESGSEETKHDGDGIISGNLTDNEATNGGITEEPAD